jgi:hypothetical protein
MTIRFLWNNLADAATLTASSESADFPVSNLKDRRYKVHHRTTGVASEWWKWDLGTAQNIYAFLFWYHNFQSGATITIQANTVDSWAAPAFEEVLTWSTFKLVKLFSSVKTYRWWRLLVADAGNPDGYLRAGRPFLGGQFEPSRNFTKDWEEEIVDLSEVEYSDGGQAFANEKDIYSQIDLQFLRFSASDRDTFKTIAQAVGKKKAFFIILEPSDPVNTAYYVHSIVDWKIIHVYAYQCYSLALTLREEL